MSTLAASTCGWRSWIVSSPDRAIYSGSPGCSRSGRVGLRSRRGCVTNTRRSFVKPRIAASAARVHGQTLLKLSDEEDSEEDWVSGLFEDLDQDERAGSRELDDNAEKKGKDALENEHMDDWSEKARRRAILSIQERGLPVGALLEDRNRIKRNKKKKKKREVETRRKTMLEDAKLMKSLRTDMKRNLGDSKDNISRKGDNPLLSKLVSRIGYQDSAGIGSYWSSVNQLGRIRVDEGVVSMKDEFLTEDYVDLERTESRKGPQKVITKDRLQEGFEVNRRLVDGGSAHDVLAVVGSIIENDPSGSGECFLSPTNISTALHRIAKHMEQESTTVSGRLAFARERTMARLVSAAMESLAQCSAQSVSNIAWALSKVGGTVLYVAEMDILAEVAAAKIGELEPQHVANMAGAFASMRHSSSLLFKALDERASSVFRGLQPQELAQLLWSFATLNEPAKRLLDTIDSYCVSGLQAEVETTFDSFCGEKFFSMFSQSELCNLSWSFLVLNELDRPSFAVVWDQIIRKCVESSFFEQEEGLANVQLTQLHQVFLSLRLEYPDLDLEREESLRSRAEKEWEKLKKGKMSTSTTQKHVEILLASTGKEWISEYSTASYSLDLALAEEQVAIEIDGPSHFARNTGEELGHTLLKRRQLAAAGWTLFSVPYLEWEELEGEQEQMGYLRNLLRTTSETEKF